MPFKMVFINVIYPLIHLSLYNIYIISIELYIVCILKEDSKIVFYSLGKSSIGKF